ncbi:hypothetical protein Bca101_058148 [Brassica carinata]
MLLWLTITGVPSHYKKDESYRSIGGALGEVDKVDVDNGRVRVHINVDEPLQFERQAGYANGDVIKVSLVYEELHRFCFTCKRISHEEGTCPELSPKQRERNRIARLEQKEKEEKAAREAFSNPSRGLKNRYDPLLRNEQNYVWEKSAGFPQIQRRIGLCSLRKQSMAIYVTESHQREMVLLKMFGIDWIIVIQEEIPVIGRDITLIAGTHRKARDGQRELQKATINNEDLEIRNHPQKNKPSAPRPNSGPRKASQPKPKQERHRDYPQDFTNKKELVVRPTRVSADSQRTISDAYRYHRSEHLGRSRENQSRQDARTESRMEWQPVRSVERPFVDQGRARDEGETEEEK